MEFDDGYFSFEAQDSPVYGLSEEENDEDLVRKCRGKSLNWIQNEPLEWTDNFPVGNDPAILSKFSSLAMFSPFIHGLVIQSKKKCKRNITSTIVCKCKKSRHGCSFKARFLLNNSRKMEAFSSGVHTCEEFAIAGNTLIILHRQMIMYL